MGSSFPLGTILTSLLLASSVMPETIITAPNPCTSGLPAYTIMNLCYNATYDLIRRGLADDIATGHVRTAMSELVRYAISRGHNRSTVALGNVCIPVERYSSIFTVRWSTVYSETELDDMLMSISNAFYHINSTEGLPPLTQSQKNDRETYKTAMQEQLRVPMVSISYVKILMPPTVTNAHDAKRQESCVQWDKYKDHPKKTPALVGTRRQLKLVVDLIRLGCDPLSVWQLLRHYTALVHLGIRCERKEGVNLMVPDYFTSSYSLAMIRLIRQAKMTGQLKKIDPSHEAAFDAMFGFEYARLSTHGSWGQADSYFASGMTIKNLMLFTTRVSSTQLEMTEKLIGQQYSEYTVARFFLAFAQRTPDCSSAANYHYGSEAKCNVNKNFCYYEASSPKTWYHNCCESVVCANAVNVGTTFTNYADCCAACNQGECAADLKKDDSIEVPNNNAEENGVEHIYV